MRDRQNANEAPFKPIPGGCGAPEPESPGKPVWDFQ